MKCEHCQENDARYTNCGGEKLCSLCDMKSGNPSIRDIDLPYLLALVDQVLNPKLIYSDQKFLLSEMRRIVSNSQG